MPLVEYTLEEHVAVISMNSGDNRFNPDFIQSMLDTLDAVENQTDAQTLVVKSGHEKIFCNGLDIDWLLPVIQSGDISSAKQYFYQLNDLFKRIVTYPMVTIAAINGHAFGAGAIISCGFDFRFMRSDRGFFCLPEVDLGIPFLPGMNAMLKKAIPMYKLAELQYTGRRITAEECEQHHMILKACHVDELMDQVLAWAKSVKKDRNHVAELKKRLNRDIVDAIEQQDPPYIESGQYRIESARG